MAAGQSEHAAERQAFVEEDAEGVRRQTEEAESEISGEQKSEPNLNAAGKDMLDPDVQFKILKPDILEYTLHLVKKVERQFIHEGKPATTYDEEPYEKKIQIRAALTPNDVDRRHILDYLGSLAASVRAEMARFLPVGQPMTIEWIGMHPAYYESAMVSPAVRERARECVAILARVPVSEIAEGMDNQSLTTATALLLELNGYEAARAKKYEASGTEKTQKEQASASSTQPSRRRTGGRKSTRTRKKH